MTAWTCDIKHSHRMATTEPIINVTFRPLQPPPSSGSDKCSPVTYEHIHAWETPMSGPWAILPMQDTFQGCADAVCSSHAGSCRACQRDVSHQLTSLAELKTVCTSPVSDSLISHDIKLPPWSRSAPLRSLSGISDMSPYLFMHHVYSNSYRVRCLEHTEINDPAWPSCRRERQQMGSALWTWVVTGA